MTTETGTHRAEGSASDEAAVMAGQALWAAGWSEAMTIDQDES